MITNSCFPTLLEELFRIDTTNWQTIPPLAQPRPSLAVIESSRMCHYREGFQALRRRLGSQLRFSQSSCPVILRRKHVREKMNGLSGALFDKQRLRDNGRSQSAVLHGFCHHSLRPCNKFDSLTQPNLQCSKHLTVLSHFAKCGTERKLH